MITNSFTSLFHFDQLSVIMIALVGFIGLTVASFASRYLSGDTYYTRFFILLSLLVGAVMVMVSADHLLLLLTAWGVSNLLLVKLMVHKAKWKAARASGILASKNFTLGFGLIGAAFGLLYMATGQTSIHRIVHASADTPMILSGLLLLLIGAMTQSAIWPFHRWLTSSLNSPTPVSALMHAGLVNAGGFLLVRFAPLYFDTPHLLTVIFIIGLITSLVGTLWKLMQHDIKRMLACSTIGQMGFMLVQCGLGLFSAAVAHLCFHGLFKAYLFLSSGGVAQEKRLNLDYPPSNLSFVLCLICGVLGSYCFALISHKQWLAINTNLVLVVIALIAGSQFALTMLRRDTLRMLPYALFFTSLMGGLYGESIHLIDSILTPLNLMQPQPLNAFHLVGLALLVLAWIGIIFGSHSNLTVNLPRWMLWLYVKALNASQPHPVTITAHRNHYHI